MAVLGYEAYDSDDRSIEAKLTIHTAPVAIDVTETNYLTYFELQEEASAAEKSIFGSVTANMLTFKMFNANQDFSPLSTHVDAKPIIQGTKVVPYMRCFNGVDVTAWESMGEYFIKELDGETGNPEITFTAYDYLYEILNKDTPAVSISKDVSVGTFISDLLVAAGADLAKIECDANLGTLNMAYVKKEKMGGTLASLAEAFKLAIFMSRTNKIKIVKLLADGVKKGCLDDTNQVVSVPVPLRISKLYSGIDITYYLPSISDVKEVLSIRDLAVEAVTADTDRIDSYDPIYCLSYASSTYDTKINDISGDSLGAKLNYTAAQAGTATFIVYGKTIDTVSASIKSENRDNVLSVDNEYIQTKENAEAYKLALDKYIASNVPVLSVNARMNLKYAIGDVVQVKSATYGVDTEIKITKVVLRYDGFLKGMYEGITMEVMR